MTTPSTENPQQLFTPFLPTTFTIPEDDVLKPFLNDRFAQISDIVNQKKIGIYGPYENFNGELWYYKTTGIERNGYQAILYIPSLVDGTNTYALPIQSIDQSFVVTHVWGSASLPVTTPGTGRYFSFYGSGTTNCTFTMTDQSIILVTSGFSAYSAFIVIEYLRAGT
jgi:hypothetical protein